VPPGAKRNSLQSTAGSARAPLVDALDLSDAEHATLIEPLRGEVENTRFPLAPRVKVLRAILAKLGVASASPAVSH
jgi:hypothetical protein